MAQLQSKRKMKIIDGISIIPSGLLLPEIIFEILLRSPVETLLRCMSVCKSWYALISSRYFINTHVRLWTSRHEYVHPRLIFSLTFIRLSSNLPCIFVPVFVIGSCNGLLCIVQEWDPFLYNPSTRIYKRLRYSGLSGGPRRGYSFGYDESSDDYKVVGLSPDNKLAKIYSLKTDRWNDINAVPHISPLCTIGTFSNGAIHWRVCEMVHEESALYFELTNIVSFDLANETFGEVSPPPVYGNICDSVSLGTLGEWLCVIVHYKGIRADLWVMKVYGVEDSWFKLVSIPYYTKEGFYSHVSMSNDGRYLLTCYNKLVVYNSMKCSFTEIHNFEDMFKACTLVDSLVSPHPLLIRNKLRKFLCSH